MIKNIISPLIVDLQKRVLDRNNIDNSDQIWYSPLPGVTKIKIHMKSRIYYTNDTIYYTIQHKMGRNGGKNYHIQGTLKLKEDERELSKQI